MVASTPIDDLALLSDCHTAALVDRRGEIVWWCPPDFDSPSVFGRLLDDTAGHFRIEPMAAYEVTRHYLDRSLVLVTRFRTEEGELELTDALALKEGARKHEVGSDSPHVILRSATCVSGRVGIEVEFAPRMEYGLTAPLIEPADGGVVARGGAVQLLVSSSVDLVVVDSTARGTADLHEGDTVTVAVAFERSWEPVPQPWTPDDVESRLDDTIAGWRSWSELHQRYAGPFEDLVGLSGRVLYGLTYRPTGAVVAAPTTSLPEAVGGGRNWDYRFSWVRDASLTLDALWVAACPDEAHAFVSYLTTSAASIHGGDRLPIMFGIRGERDLTERELPWLSGWGASRPVRVGNQAWRQSQIDVYGELLAAVHRLRDEVTPLPAAERRMLVTLAHRASESWQDADQGIWEIRAEPRHYVHSKLMCWVAQDRALQLADDLDATDDDVRHWRETRDEIRRAIEDHGWSEEAGAFTQAFGSTALDASALMIPIVGFLPPDDPRVVATIDAIQQRLTDDRGLVYRYRTADGLEGEEGTFLLCTFWLAEALALAGRTERAREVFARAAGHANDLGLLSEEVESGSATLLGNFPQAFSHIGLVNAAWAIHQAEGGHPETAPQA